MSHADWGIVLLGGGTICSAIIVWGACRLAGASDDRSERLALKLRNDASCDDAEWQGWIAPQHLEGGPVDFGGFIKVHGVSNSRQRGRNHG